MPGPEAVAGAILARDALARADLDPKVKEQVAKQLAPILPGQVTRTGSSPGDRAIAAQDLAALIPGAAVTPPAWTRPRRRCPRRRSSGRTAATSCSWRSPACAPPSWVGCDGGLFRSDADGDSGTFANRNDGLAVMQPGYVASHPTNPGIVAAGFQDERHRGPYRRRRLGAALPRRRRRHRLRPGLRQPLLPGQYTSATWESSDGRGIAPVHRRNASAVGTLKTSETIEDDSSPVRLRRGRGRPRRRRTPRARQRPRLVHARLGRGRG